MKNKLTLFEKIWARYEEGCMGYSAKERAESGLKTARCYGECRLIKIDNK